MSSREKSIPVFIPELPPLNKWQKYIENSYKVKHFSNFGPNSKELESRIAQILDLKAENVASCTNATLALMGAIETSSNKFERWSLPAWTFAATACAIYNTGRPGEFLDVDQDMRVVPSADTKNLIDVLPFGESIDVDRINSLQVDNLLIDAAASFDALTKTSFKRIRRRYGLVISFHPTKLPAGPEGAVFISNDINWTQRFRSWSVFGFNENRESVAPGTNAKINEFNSSIILASLDEWSKTISKWNQRMEEIVAFCEKINLICHAAMRKGFVSPYWIIQSQEINIKRLEENLRHESISYKHWWSGGCHQMPSFREFKRGRLDQTDYFSRSTIGLPIFESLADDELERIFQVLLKTFKQ